jgi:hypothetical protein
MQQPKVRLIGNWLTLSSTLCAHNLTSLWKAVHTMKVSTRTVTCLIVRRVTRSVLERDVSGERVFFNPPRELGEHVACHFGSCRRTTPATTMDVFVLLVWAKFSTITRHWNCTNSSLLGRSF